MSGDVQPRKRKGKRRKRADHEYHIQRIQCLEDEDAGTPPPTLIGPSEHADNVTIHIHKEGGIGGHWCARIIFFFLFAVLVALVGVIIFETRGSTDVDTPVASSKWAMIFEGWVDDSVSLHEESHDKGHEDVSHEEDAEENGEEEEEDEHGEEEEEDERAESKEEADASEEAEDEKSPEDAEPDVEDDDDETGEDEDKDEEEGEEDEEEENGNASQAMSEENEDSGDNEEEEEDEGDEEEDNDSGALEEVDEDDGNSKDGQDDDDNEEDDEESKEEADAELLDMSLEGINLSTANDEDEDENEKEDLSYEFLGIPGVNEIDDDSNEPLEEIEDDQEIEEIPNPVDIEPEEEEEVEEESSSVAVKFGVGVALVVAAHFVLVRRWSNVDAQLAALNGEGSPDLSRRDTIITPESLLTPKVMAKEPKQEVKIEGPKLSSAPAKAPEPQIASIPTRKEVEAETSESERRSGTEEELDYEEDSLEEEEDEEEEDEEGEEEDDMVQIDDTELVAKLEAKYGKLPTPSQSEEEEDLEDEELEDEEEEEEEEEGETEEDEDEETEKNYDWKHVKAPKAHSGSAPAEGESKPRDTRGNQGRGATGGPQDNFINTSDVDDVIMQEELENWLMRDFDN